MISHATGAEAQRPLILTEGHLGLGHVAPGGDQGIAVLLLTHNQGGSSSSGGGIVSPG